MTACHPGRPRALEPFRVHIADIRGIAQINAPPLSALKGPALSLKCPLPPLAPTLRRPLRRPPLTFPLPTPLHLRPGSPSPFLPPWPCLWASPLEGQVNGGAGPAQARLVPIRCLIRHFIFSLTACPPAAERLSTKAQHQDMYVWVCVCVCAFWFQQYGGLEVHYHISWIII